MLTKVNKQRAYLTRYRIGPGKWEFSIGLKMLVLIIAIKKRNIGNICFSVKNYTELVKETL